jgi:hypothetical protein
MREPSDSVTNPRPGEIMTYEDDARSAHKVGERVELQAMRISTGSGGPSAAGPEPAPTAPWEVIRIEPIEGSADRVKVYLKFVG